VAGLTVLLVATSSGLARYAFVTQTAHIAQYLLLGLVAPALLVLGCRGLPARALPVGGPDDEFRDPRRWWDVARTSALAGSLRRPWVALAAAAVVLYGGTTGPVLEVVLRSHVAHLLSVALTVAAGCVLTSSWFGPAGEGARPARWIAAWLSVHLAASLVLLVWPRVLARGWWAEVTPAWVDSSADQRAAAITSVVGGLAVAVAALSAVRTARLATTHEPVVDRTPS
jgi:putative copper resistance protein D